MEKIIFYFLLFMIYSIVGWIMEVILKLFQYKRFINRGFLIGPYCPIYGVGGVLITLLLSKYSDDIIALFVFAVLICSVLEYYTSYFMEKIFKARWWDYSTRKFNINGRICLNTMIPFGLLGTLIVHYINPKLYEIYTSIDERILYIIVIFLVSLFLTDLIVSLIILFSIRKDNKLLEKDNTEEMSNKIKEIIRNENILSRRLLNAFPNFKHIGIAIKENGIKAGKFIIDKHKEFVSDTEKKLEKLENRYNHKIEKIRKKYTDKVIEITKRNK